MQVAYLSCVAWLTDDNVHSDSFPLIVRLEGFPLILNSVNTRNIQ